MSEHHAMVAEAFYLTPTFWVAVAFITFIALMFKPLMNAIAGALDSRSAHIAGELAEARHLREEAEAALMLYRSKQQESIAEAKALITRAKEDADRIRASAVADMKAALDKRMKLSLERIAQAEQQALTDVRHHMVDIALAAARALVEDQVQAGAGEDLVRRAAEDLGRKLH